MGLLLAGGRDRRVGDPKALLRHGDTLLVDRAVDLLGETGCTPLVVVLGAHAEQVRAQARLDDATVVVNRGCGTGVGSSLRAGLAALAGTDVDAALVIPVDMPRAAQLALLRRGQALVPGDSPSVPETEAAPVRLPRP